MVSLTTIKLKLLMFFRWIISVLFFFLGITKVQLIYNEGLSAFVIFSKIAGFPEYFKYYGLIALLIEFFLAIGLWIKSFYGGSIVLGVFLSFLGVLLSFYSIYMRVSTDCSCGLLGHNEMWLLFQKILIISVLCFLYKGKQLLFMGERA